MSEALALRELAAAIERRDALLKFLDDEHCEGQLAGNSGLAVSCYWAASCVGHKELMAELTRVIRSRVPELLGAVRAAANNEVDECRKVLAAASGVALPRQITEGDVTAALQAACLLNTPESRKDMRRALEKVFASGVQPSDGGQQK